jgi:hypothetical protein
MKTLRRAMIWLLCLNLAGCTSWRLTQKSEVAGLEERQRTIRITLRDGSHYESANYQFTADSLIFVTGKTPFFEGMKRAVARDDLLAVEKEVVDPKESILGLTSIAIFLYLML